MGILNKIENVQFTGDIFFDNVKRINLLADGTNFVSDSLIHHQLVNKYHSTKRFILSYPNQDNKPEIETAKAEIANLTTKQRVNILMLPSTRNKVGEKLYIL